MEEKALSKPIMVSRLPKFGARPQGGSSPLANGSVQPAANPEGKGVPPGKQNGMVRMSSFSLKWKKDGGSSGSQPSPEERAGSEEDGASPRQRQQSPAAREIKKPSTPTTKARRPATATLGPASPKAAAQTPKSGPRGIPKQAGSGQTAALNGLGGGSAGRFGFGSGLMRPRAGSSSTRSSSRDSLSQSSDSLKSLSLDNMVRSQSFTHFKQLPSPTATPIIRSFSFNKAVELAKPLANTQLRTKTPVIKPPLVVGGGRGGGLQYHKAPVSRPGVAPGCSTPPSPIKKLLLPSCILSKPPALAYRLGRPTSAKQPRPLLTGKVLGDHKLGDGGSDSTETSPVTSDPLSDAEKATLVLPDSEPGGARYLGERLEDMSLSSASSLERNDTSEEYLDDFDNLGDGGGMLLHPAHTDDGVPDNRQHGTPTRTRLRGFLSDDVDWTGMGLAGGPDHSRSLALSPEVDFPHGSSLELSPSNSSGGTYMWDEEGLEPLGPTHPCGSFDSDINSMDILDHLESCDLEDDDLMLDVDLPEDGSLHSDADGMSHFEHAERGGRQGHWRRRQHRWSGPDHFHNDNRGAIFSQFDGYSGPGLGRMVPRRDSHTVALDELTLRHMAQDCSSVKSQLLKLKNLLQMEDGDAVQDALLSGVLSPESSDDTSTALQVEELMREVQDLREELRKKEKTIAQLTQQVSAPAQAMRCQCQQRAPVVRGERRTHHDKATQTPWRGHGPQILQPSKRSRSEPRTPRRLANSAPSEDLCDSRPPRDQPCSLHWSDDTTAAPVAEVRQTHDPDKLSRLLSANLKTTDAGNPTASLQPAGKTLPPGAQRRAQIPQARVFWSPRLHKRVVIPALPHGTGASDLKTLPPPSRGLPCFGMASQPLSPDLSHARYGLTQPQTHRDAPSHTEAERNVPKARGLVPPNHSRHPKPKIQ